MKVDGGRVYEDEGEESLIVSGRLAGYKASKFIPYMPICLGELMLMGVDVRAAVKSKGTYSTRYVAVCLELTHPEVTSTDSPWISAAVADDYEG